MPFLSSLDNLRYDACIIFHKGSGRAQNMLILSKGYSTPFWFSDGLSILNMDQNHVRNLKFEGISKFYRSCNLHQHDDIFLYFPL